MRWCRDCIYWYGTIGWKGNCRLHPWKRDKYSEDADATRCDNYLNKYDTPQYRSMVASPKET